MKLNQLTKHSSITEERFLALVEVKGVEMLCSVLKTTNISMVGTPSHTRFSIKRFGNKISKKERTELKKLIEEKINKFT
jgi:hypothetical protein